MTNSILTTAQINELQSNYKFHKANKSPDRPMPDFCPVVRIEFGEAGIGYLSEMKPDNDTVWGIFDWGWGFECGWHSLLEITKLGEKYPLKVETPDNPMPLSEYDYEKDI